MNVQTCKHKRKKYEVADAFTSHYLSCYENHNHFRIQTCQTLEMKYFDMFILGFHILLQNVSMPLFNLPEP